MGDKHAIAPHHVHANNCVTNNCVIVQQFHIVFMYFKILLDKSRNLRCSRFIFFIVIIIFIIIVIVTPSFIISERLIDRFI